MTEPENFDDELFADLYADDDTGVKPAASAPAQADQSAVVQPTAEVQQEENHDSTNGNEQYQDYSGGGDYQQQGNYDEEEEDDDDDIDFNLGNGPTNTIIHHDNHEQQDDHEQHDEKQSYGGFSGAPPQNNKGPNAKEDGKMFIGGLNWETTDQSLREYFSQFGEVIECTVMRDGATGRSRGFGFLTFKDPKTVNIVMVKEHYLDGKIIDPKRAIPRDEQEKTSKIFVGGVSQETTDQEFREYFAQFGRVVDATLMMDKDTGRPRGFGFVTFESEAGVDACLSTELEIHGKPIEVKKAQPRGNLREEEEAARRNGGGKFGRKGNNTGNGMDDGSGNQMMGGMGGGGGAGGAPGGMTPQVMAQYFQRMQQTFAMMQQQMMMNRNMNPAMMQMMQMQQMQQMQQAMMQAGRGGGNPMAAMQGMNPAMMQQMQQMMAQQGGGPMGGPGGPDGGVGGPGGQNVIGSPTGGGHAQPQLPGPQSGNGGGPGGPLRHGGFNAYEQQQFEQQKYVEQQQGRRGGSRGAPDMQMPQQGFNPGFGGGMGGGGPTSWEGMYDDVPQPMMAGGGGVGVGVGGFNPGGGGGRGGFHKNRGSHHHHNQHQGSMSPGPIDPNNAPPANAPTGPKNAGRPGANYRGGGRGGNRGFHPYARG